jgi:AraC-like DNA-binding protein
VYDLSPWDSSALAFLRQRSAALATAPILLYLPPTGAAFAALAHVPKSEYTGLQVQARDGNSLRHLHDATNTLVNGLPRVHIMRQLTEAIPDLSGVARLFAHRALRILGSGQRPTVAAIARGLGLSPRTLQRRFAADGLPPPKALLDGLTLAHVDAVARMQNLSVARAAARAGLTSNDLYRLRKRGAHTNVLPSEVLVRRIRGN